MAETLTPSVSYLHTKKQRVTAAEKARRAELAQLYQSDIEDNQRQFGESFEAALDRVVAAHDEFERLLADIVAKEAA